LSPEDFIFELDGRIRNALARIGALSVEGKPAESIGIPQLLMLALKAELEATEIAAHWLLLEPDLDVKLALARQCGDEAKHYKLIEQRLEELDTDLSVYDPRAGGQSPMLDFLKGLPTTVERVAAGQFAREALAKVRNQIFLEYCEELGDPGTARLYRDVIQPDEGHHHELGRRLLLRLAVTKADQDRARTAVTRTLELAEELQEMARMKRGVARAPGC
jgi:hypothetical protein